MPEECVVWQGVGLALRYTGEEPWPYELVMDKSAEGASSTCILDRYELASLRDALSKHLDQL